MTKDSPKKVKQESKDSKDSKDVAKQKDALKAEDKKEAVAVDPEEELFSDIKYAVSLIEKSVSSLEARYTSRALRFTASIRRRISDAALLKKAINSTLSATSTIKPELLAVLATDGAMEVEAATPAKLAEGSVSIEVEIYFGYLVVLHLHDQEEYILGSKLSTRLVDLIVAVNRRTLDELAAKIYFYHARFYELQGTLAQCRPQLLTLQKTATLRNDLESQAVLLNLILRNYLHYSLYDQADKLVSKSVMPESTSNNQMARYLYYLGRIKATQLEYTSAHRHLFQAFRKAPASPKYAAGFQQAVQKFLVIVQLLMGTIPEHSLFKQPVFRKSLAPYLSIVQAVRVGDLAKFQQTLASFSPQFRADKTFTLILRLRHNVIKTGIRMISMSYSRISLKDICLKLQLDSEENAEYIVAKAIRDGVVDAKINHEKAYMQSTESSDVYSTAEPQDAFHERINFCLNLHDDCVKSMRYPMGLSDKKDAVNPEDTREEEINLLSEIMDADDDDPVGGDF